MTAADTPPKKRASYIGVPQMFDLNFACRAVVEAYGYSCYLVGSSLDRRDYRDVDIRCILPDDEFDRLFPKLSCPDFMQGRLALLNAAISQWLASRSGLPIDFQFQRRTEANAEYKGVRNAIGMCMWGNE